MYRVSNPLPPPPTSHPYETIFYRRVAAIRNFSLRFSSLSLLLQNINPDNTYTLIYNIIPVVYRNFTDTYHSASARFSFVYTFLSFARRLSGFRLVHFKIYSLVFSSRYKNILENALPRVPVLTFLIAQSSRPRFSSFFQSKNFNIRVKFSILI